MDSLSNDVHVQALVDAASKGDLDGVQLALRDGAEINAVADKVYHTAITAATLRGYGKVVESLLRHGADPNAFENETALGIAVRRGDIEIAKVLLAAGADVNRGSAVGETPLMGAASNARLDCARLLIDAGADVNAVSAMEKVPLSEAYDYEWRFRKRNPVVDLLIDVGANVGIHDNWNDWERPAE